MRGGDKGIKRLGARIKKICDFLEENNLLNVIKASKTEYLVFSGEMI